MPAPRILRSFALLSTGLLAGALGYGAAALVPTFNAVPLDVRLTFHTALMRMNGPVVQAVMACAAGAAVALAVRERGRPRRLAAGSAALVVTSFLVTRFGNIPINARIRAWAAGVAPPDHADMLRRWELFNDLRTAAAVAAFVLLLAAAASADPAHAGRPADPARTDGAAPWNG